MTDRSSLFPRGAVFTVQPETATALGDYREPFDQKFDLTVVEFNDCGSLVDCRQKQAMLDCITRTRRSNFSGAVVVVFIHGWRNSARWNRIDGPDDQNFAGFRKVLATLSIRESERAGGRSRSVIGVFLAWDGVPARWRHWLEFATFFNRNRTAKTIGGSEPMRTTLREIVRCTKDPVPIQPPELPVPIQRQESPLILASHSLGAMMLETAFLALLDEKDSALDTKLQTNPHNAAQVTQAGRPVSFPDVLIGLNSAGDSTVTKAIIAKLEERQVTKSIGADPIAYSPPLFVSVTATADWVTGFVWRFASLFRRRTVGHDKTLFTHTFAVVESNAYCPKKDRPDFGQHWSCLRPPCPPDAPSPSFLIDLPERDRSQLGDPTHTRYQLTPRGGHGQTLPVWVFQVPPWISKSHSDIFNPRCSLLMLALMQISGAVMSLATDWKDNFEPLSPDPRPRIIGAPVTDPISN